MASSAPTDPAVRPRAVVLDGYALNPGDLSWSGIEALCDLTVHDRTPPGDVLARAAEADILLTNKTPLPAAVIDALPRLRFITVLATGHNIVDGAAARARGIPVSNVPGYSTDSVAQHTLALLLELCHRVGDHHRSVQEGGWVRSPDFAYWIYPVRELTGLTLGLVGYGAIGRRVGQLARAFGMEILAHTPRQRDLDGARWTDLPELLARADVVSLHCPQTPATTGLVGREFLAAMKPTAFLLNTARGGLVRETELAAALSAGVIAGAALDVIATEPMPAGHPLLGLPNCLLTPHIAWTSRPARERLLEITAGNIRAFLAGSGANVVN
jgi:glycerate dehydrogenase